MDWREIYKTMHNFCSLIHNTRTRGRSGKLLSGRVRIDKRRWDFTRYTINLWNSLPKDVVVVVASSVGGF